MLNESFSRNIFLSKLNIEWDICQISLFLKKKFNIKSAAIWDIFT